MKNKKIIFIVVLVVLLICLIPLLKNDGNGKNNGVYMHREIKYEGDEDYDGDGLSNIKERELKTDVYTIDTDGDGLTDYEEVEVYHTNPLEIDTDGDKLNDYNEVIVGYNPTVKDYDNQEIHASYDFGEYHMEVTGTGNIANTYPLGEYDTNVRKNCEGAIKQYTFESEGNVKEAEVTVTLTDEDLELAHLSRYDVHYGMVQAYKLDPDDYSNVAWMRTASDENSLKFTFKIPDINAVYLIGEAKMIKYPENVKKEKTDVVADSGFRPEKDGFSFKNYINSFSDGGHCAGMALFANWYYNDILPMKHNEVVNKYESDNRDTLYKYDLSSIKHLTSHKPLYDYKLSSPLLGYVNNLKAFNYDDFQTNSKYNKDDVQILNAIGQFFILGNNMKHEDSYFKKDIGYDFSFMDRLIKRVNSGEAVAIYYDKANGDGHVVNVYKIVKKLLHYELYYYDNTDPYGTSNYSIHKFDVVATPLGHFIANENLHRLSMSESMEFELEQLKKFK